MADKRCVGCGGDLSRAGGIKVTETVTRFYPARLLADGQSIECDMASAGMPEEAGAPAELRCSLCGREIEEASLALRGWHV